MKLIPGCALRHACRTLFIAVLACPFPDGARAMGSLPTGPSEQGTETELQPATLLSDMMPAHVRFLPDREFYTELEQAVLASKREVVVTAHYFEVSEETKGRARDVADLLAATARRGVEVVVVVELGKEASFITRSNRRSARYLMERGVKVYGDMSGTVVHSNLVVIDRRLVFMGSPDFTHPSLARYREAAVAVDSAPLATAVLRYIESLEPHLYREP
jgi:phosphatidylserine/phosphatidylglycerophosphate/cardiolipin synthase-like enzyme